MVEASQLDEIVTLQPTDFLRRSASDVFFAVNNVCKRANVVACAGEVGVLNSKWCSPCTHIPTRHVMCLEICNLSNLLETLGFYSLYLCSYVRVGLFSPVYVSGVGVRILELELAVSTKFS